MMVSLPERLGLYVGSGVDVYHGLELCAVGQPTSVVCSRAARAAVPDDVWLSVGGCREIAAADRVPDDQFRSRGITAILATGFDLAADGEQLARLAAGIRAVAIEPLGVGQRPRLDAPTDTARFFTVSAVDGVPDADYATFAFDALRFAISRGRGPLSNRRVVVTAGGTREPLDPVRFITNRSSGLMGHALALAAREQGADVTLISSADRLSSPCGVDRIRFQDVASLREAVLMAAKGADVLVMAAAVSDYRPRSVSDHKIKKTGEGLTLELATVPNFIPEVPLGVLRVGFAAETDPDLAKATAKLASRGFHMLCLNDVSRPDAGFEVATNALTILDPTGIRVQTPLLPKTKIAHIVMDHVAELLP